MKPQTPVDTVGSSVETAPVKPTPAPQASPRCVSGLMRAGRAVAMAAVMGVAGLGLAVLGPHHSSQQIESFHKAEQVLRQDGQLNDLIARSSFDGLLDLMQRPDLPGDSARDRLDFVMWLTDSNRGSDKSSWDKLKQIFTHFQPQSPFVTRANDRGFAHDVSDGRKWYNPDATGFVEDVYHGKIDQGSPQVGHFLTAVDIGRQPRPVELLLHTAAVGHELIGDDQGALRQVVEGTTHVHQRALFGQAVAAAQRGDRAEAHRLVEEILPDLSDSGQEPGRVGNSKQDLLNTSYGLAFGRLVRSGHFQSRQEAADWLRHNVGSEAPSLAWNDPR